MNRQQIERYFNALSSVYSNPCIIILTGAAAGALYGNVRATMDIDFAVTTEDWELFTKAIAKVSDRMAIEAQYAEDIDRWSSITLMDYKAHTYLHKRFGSIEIHLMEPPYWAIGKLSRYLDSDIGDLVKVFIKTNTSWQHVASIAGNALRKSPKSTSCNLFVRQVEDFFKSYGPKTWGKKFPIDEAIKIFRDSAGIIK